VDSQKLNTWLSLAANVGVIIGLLLLVVEINQNNQITRVQIEQQRTESAIARQMETASGDHLAPLFAKLQGLEQGSDISSVMERLTAEERARLRFVVASIFLSYENMYFQYQSGFLSAEYWEDNGVQNIAFWGPMWKAMFPPRGPGGRRAFKDEVERILEMGIEPDHRLGHEPDRDMAPPSARD
jgi:hypothetical protein